MTTRYTRLVIAMALAAGVSGAPHAAQETNAPSVAGKWTLSVDSPHGATTMGLSLKQDGKKVTGTFASPHGDSPVEGELVDGTLTLATTSTQPEAPQVTFNATLKNDGTLAGYLSAAMGDMKWTAQRSK